MNRIRDFAGIIMLTLGLAGLPLGPGLCAEEPHQEKSLSLKEAFVLGLNNSHAIKSAFYNPLQAEQDYQKARAIYDLAVFMNGSVSKTDQPTESLLDGVPVSSALQEDRWRVQAGVKQRLPTGGSLALYEESSRLSSNSEYVTPEPQYKSRLVASLTQPLLKGLGDKEGATTIRVAELNRQGVLLFLIRVYAVLVGFQNFGRHQKSTLAKLLNVCHNKENRQKCLIVSVALRGNSSNILFIVTLIIIAQMFSLVQTLDDWLKREESPYTCPHLPSTCGPGQSWRPVPGKYLGFTGLFIISA